MVAAQRALAAAKEAGSGAAIAQAPKKADNPKGMQIRQEFYEKRKRDTAEYEAELAGKATAAAPPHHRSSL